MRLDEIAEALGGTVHGDSSLNVCRTVHPAEAESETDLALAMENNLVPPTINHKTNDEEIDQNINFTFGVPQKREVNVAISNTFGFGGHNACVLFKKIS